MKYLLDTNACIHLLKRNRPRLSARVSANPADAFGISAITLAELWHGAFGSSEATKTAERLRTFVSVIRPVAFDAAAAEAAGEVFAALGRIGKPIGPKETLIAGHALALGVTLVTSNTREFRRVKGLRVADWAV